MLKVAINGFGRIGKTFFRTIIEDESSSNKLKVVVINVGPEDPEYLPYFIKYDSILPTYKGQVSYKNNILYIKDLEIAVISEKDPSKANWSKYNVDWVVECSGQFTSYEKALPHITDGGAKKVLISAPGKNPDVTIIPGINSQDYKPEKHNIVSLGSCTTNALVPMLYVLEKEFGIENAFMTTVHSYTNSQALLDVMPSKKVTRSRAAALNIVPTTTGAMELAHQLIPSLKNKMLGCAMRVPVGTVSIVDLNFTSRKPITPELINQAYKKHAQGSLKSILAVSEEPLVSTDYRGLDESVAIDSFMTLAQDNIGKVLGWYDNEWGYSMRLRDFLISTI